MGTPPTAKIYRNNGEIVADEDDDDNVDNLEAAETFKNDKTKIKVDSEQNSLKESQTPLKNIEKTITIEQTKAVIRTNGEITIVTEKNVSITSVKESASTIEDSINSSDTDPASTNKTPNSLKLIVEKKINDTADIETNNEDSSKSNNKSNGTLINNLNDDSNIIKKTTDTQLKGVNLNNKNIFNESTADEDIERFEIVKNNDFLKTVGV